MPALLLELPEELLLEIIDHLPHLPRDRRSELVKLASVNKRIGSIATDLLHKHLLINIQNLRMLLDLYVAKPFLADKVVGLDLYSRVNREGTSGNFDERLFVSRRDICQYQMNTEMSPYHPRGHRSRSKAYLELARKEILSAMALEELERDLEEADMKAHIALLLLLILPIIRRLFLANMESPHEYFRPPVYGLSRLCGYRPIGPPVLRGIYMREIFDCIAPKLTTMEPTYHRLHDLSNFQSLGHLITSGNLLFHHLDSSQLPPALRMLSTGISDSRETIALLEHLLSHRNKGALPSLQRVEVYMRSKDPAVEDGELDCEYADPGVRARFTQVSNLVHLLYVAGVRTAVKFGNDRAVSAQFHAIALAANPGLKQQVWFEDRNVLEVRGLFEHWRPEAEKMLIEKRKKLIEMARERNTNNDEVTYPNYRTTSVD
jgi:hypothetical protein